MPQNGCFIGGAPGDCLCCDSPRIYRIPRMVSCFDNTRNSFLRSVFFGIYTLFLPIEAKTRG